MTSFRSKFIIAIFAFTNMYHFTLSASHAENLGIIEPAPVQHLLKSEWNNGFYIGAMGGVSHTAGRVRADHSLKEFIDKDKRLINTGFFGEKYELLEILESIKKDNVNINTSTYHFGTTGATYSGVLGWGTSLSKADCFLNKIYLGLEGNIGGDTGNDTIHQYKYNNGDSTNPDYKINYKKGLFFALATRLGYKISPTSMVYTRFGMKKDRRKLQSVEANIHSGKNAYAYGSSYESSRNKIQFTTGIGAETFLTQLSETTDLNFGLQYDFTLRRKDRGAAVPILIQDKTKTATKHERAFVRKLNNHTFQIRLTAVIGGLNL